MDRMIWNNRNVAEEIKGNATEKIEEKIYPMNGIKVDKGYYSVFELKRKYDAEERRVILDSDFQRQNVWSLTRKCELVESVLMGLPLPIFYFNQDKYGRLIVVDGRQRLTALFSYMEDAYPLKKLKILPELDGLKFSQLLSSKYSYFAGALEDYQIQAHVIKPPTPDRIMFDIFDRVNRGGVKLTQQEMRNALYQGKATDFLNRVVKSEEFVLATGEAFKSEKRMKDKYLVTRFIAAYLCVGNRLLDDRGERFAYRGDMDELLGRGMDAINHMTEQEVSELLVLTKSNLLKSYRYLGKDGFRLNQGEKRSPVNMNVFETVMFIMLYMPEEFVNRAYMDFAGKSIAQFLGSRQFRDNIGNHRDSMTNFGLRIDWAVRLGKNLEGNKENGVSQ